MKHTEGQIYRTETQIRFKGTDLPLLDYVYSGNTVAPEGKGIANAERIVKVWNSYDDAISALQAAIEGQEDDTCRYDHHGLCQEHNLQEKGKCWHELTLKALKNAE